VAKVTGKSEATRILVLSTEIRSVDGKVVVAGNAKVKVRETETAASAIPGPMTTTASSRSPEQRVALVTGASGGIGAEIARTLARKGHRVAVNYYRHPDRAAAVAASIEHAGGAARTVQGDVRDAASVEAMLQNVAEWSGPPTIVVNAAIGELEQRPFNELGWPDFLAHLEYQVKAVFNLCWRDSPGRSPRNGPATASG